MTLRAVEENTGWEAALEIAVESGQECQPTYRAVIAKDYLTADSLAKELKDDEEMLGTVESIDRRTGH